VVVMESKPSDFLIGVGEFIGILLPGSAVAYAALPALRTVADTYGLPALHGTAAWTAAAITAYLAGHLIFLIGSFLDEPYDWIRQRVRPREKDKTYQFATELAKRVLGQRYAALNTYKFATASLALNHETAHAEVKQLEADSKFFRSLVVLSLGVLAVSVALLKPWLAIGSLAAAAMCAWRYVERRWKATHRAFEYVVIIYGAESKG
jgi:hypothetical protein